MSGWQRFLIGGVGGLAPALMFLAVTDLEMYIEGATQSKIIGYSIRVFALFILGGFIAYLHTDESKPFKLFEVGLAGPALLAGYITSSSLQNRVDATPNTDPSQRSEISVLGFFLASATAQEPTQTNQLKTFKKSETSRYGDFWEGLTGRTQNKYWYVIIGSHLNYEKAKNQAYLMQRNYPDFNVSVYAPYGKNPYYAVVIGEALTQSQAKAIRQSAVGKAFPPDTYYKYFN